MLPRLLSFACLLSVVAAVCGAEPEKIPDGSAIEQAKKLVRDVYKADFAKKKAADQLELARKLLKEAEDTKDSPSRFVMLREARELAVKGGDVALGLDAAAITAQHFEVNLIELRVETLDAAEKAKVANGKSVADAALEVVDDIVRADDYKSADRVLKIASSAASRAGLASLPGTVSARGKEVDTARKTFEALEPVRKTLMATPTDPAANAKVGRFNCFIKGTWDAGLPMLAMCDAELIKAAAVLDLDTKQPAERAAVGDRWMALLEKLEPVEKPEVRLRAYGAYVQAAADAAGLEKARLDKLITELEKDPKVVRSRGNWLIIFRSADASLWNTNTNRGRDLFSMAHDKLPATIKFLKMSAGVKNGVAIIEMNKERLVKQSDQDGYGWNGKQDRTVPYNLGIYDLSMKDYPTGAIHILRTGPDWCRGWGFGSIYPNDREQGFTWAGAPLAKTVFEISVKSFALTPEENKFLLKRKK